MPHLDASALSTDIEGMDFLKSILDVADAPAEKPRFGFVVRQPEESGTLGIVVDAASWTFRVSENA